MWKIDTRSKVRRTNFEKLVTTDLVKETMGRIAEEQEREAELPSVPANVAVEVEEESDATQQSTPETDDGEGPNHSQSDEEMEQAEQVEPETERMEIVEEEPEGTGGQAQPIGVTRAGRSIIRPSRFLAVTKVATAEWKNEATDKAIKAELSMLFDELHALRAVRRASIKAETKILKSHMFVVETYLATGEYEKMKARLVADGRDQDADMYPNKSSPTVAIHSVFTVLGMASSKPWWIVVKIDIRSAFVQTPMSGEPVYMKLDPKITKYAVELCPELQEYVEADGCLYTLLLKALYGCIQASALWYALIRSVLEEFGYEVSKTDQCVFRKRSGERIFMLLLYVDDILAIVDAKEAKALKALLEKCFGKILFEENSKLSYLGMQVDVRPEGTVVDMSFYVQQLLEGQEVVVRLSPGTKASFTVDEKAALLDERTRKQFHSLTAKLLYLAKRARPDILTVVSFLCTRVKTATVEDQPKLSRVLGYLKGTVNRTLLLRSHGEPIIRAYVDESYVLHTDSKSHTGVVIYVGNTLAYVSSRKQKCMSKSPTEAELIGLSDNLGRVELFQEFLEFLMMQEIKMPVIYQDCQAVVSLVTKGGGVTQTKHLRARMHLGKEMIVVLDQSFAGPVLGIDV